MHDDVTYVCMMMWQHKKQGFYADGTKVDSTGWLSLRTQVCMYTYMYVYDDVTRVHDDVTYVYGWHG